MVDSGGIIAAAVRTARGARATKTVIPYTALGVQGETIDFAELSVTPEISLSLSYLMGYTGTVWVPVLCDAKGQLLTKVGA